MASKRNRFERAKHNGRGRGLHSQRYLPFNRFNKPGSTYTGRKSYRGQLPHFDSERSEHDAHQHLFHTRQEPATQSTSTEYQFTLHQSSSFDQVGDQRNIEGHVLEMIVMDLHTPSLVQEEGFCSFMNALHPHSGARLNVSWIKNELFEMYRFTQNKVQREVSNAENLVLSAELWISSKETSYLTVTCHFINKNWELKSYVLDTAHLFDKDTPDNVHQQLWRISKEWQIQDKIQVVVANVDGMKKAEPKLRWTYIPCFGHTINKVFQEVMNNPTWMSLLRKCRHIVEFIHQNKGSSWCHQLVRSPGLNWLPTLNMVKKIGEHWPKISNILCNNHGNDIWLNENERQMLRNAEQALLVIKDVTQKTGRSGYISVSNIIPILEELQTHLTRLALSRNQVAKDLVEKCQHHFGNINQNYWFTTSTALDPRFKGTILQDNKADEIKSLITKEMHLFSDQTSSTKFNTENYAHTVLRSYITEVHLRPLNPLEFWRSKNEDGRKMFRQLALVAQKYLSVVSTAIPVEQMMQQDKSKIICNRRKCLELEDVSMMLFLNGNHRKI